MMSTSDSIQLWSVAIAVVAVVVACYSFWEVRRASKWSTNYSRLLEAERMLLTYPQLLRFHGVTDEMLAKCDATPEEVVYLLLSMRAAQEALRSDGVGEDGLSPYRKNLLLHPKVALIWREILRHRLIFRTEFVSQVDKFLAGQSAA